MKYSKPIITLIAIATVMPELVTGSTTLPHFFVPINFLINFLGYGITVLVIREFFVRYNLSLLGLFLLGLAYVNINEGLIAKTMLLESGIPVSFFDHYGYIAGISIPWSFMMAVWHSVCSVMFPILAVHFLFPQASKEIWLGKKKTVFFALVVFLFSLAAFFGPFRGVGTVGQLFIILANMVLLVFAALRFGKKKEEGEVAHTITTKSVWLGVSTVLFWTVLMLFIVVLLKMPLIIFFALLFAGIVWYVNRLKKIGITNDNLLLFILGGYFQTAVTGLVVALLFAPATFGERLMSEIIILVICTILVRKVFKRHTLASV